MASHHTGSDTDMLGSCPFPNGGPIGLPFCDCHKTTSMGAAMSPRPRRPTVNLSSLIQRDIHKDKRQVRYHHRQGLGGDGGISLGFHNAKSGLCFPSYERIHRGRPLRPIDRGGTLKALENAGVLSWVHRIKRVREACPNLLGDNGWRWRVLRTSNSYTFTDPSPAADLPNSSKSGKPTETPNQGFFFSLIAAFGGERTVRSGRKEA
jgi:hypothetical protein